MNAPLAKLPLLASLLCLALLGACGNNDPNGNNGTNTTAGDMGSDMPVRCVPNERFNPDTGRCEPIFEPTDMGGDMTVPPADMGADMPAVEQDMGPDMAIDPACDKDRDGYLSYDCDGNDCDDNDPARRPGAPEICDDKDNDCDTELNEGIVCQFYAHTRDTLYVVDPFKKRAQLVEENIPQFLDIDTNPRTGELYGVTGSELWIYKEIVTGGIVRMEWQEIGSLGTNIGGANGFAIDRDGDTAFVTAQNKLYQVNLQTGRASLLTTLDNNANSSGDCVINKGNTLFMSSKEDGKNDRLLQLDGNTGMATNIGSMGGYTSHQRIYGLTFAWNRLWGLTVDGELIEIDPNTAQSRLVVKFEGVGFYGAASTPSR